MKSPRHKVSGKIAIIDYGIGGLGLYKMIREEFPHLPIIYFSDSGEVPYGKLPKGVLRSRLEKVFAYLFSLGVDQIIVACHAASSVVRESDRNVMGLRPQTIRAVVKTNPSSVGIIGGGRTIRSGYYRKELNRRGIHTKQRIAQPLSILIEKGEVNTPAVHSAVRKIMKPLKSCGSILLACTHYPVLSEVILGYSPKGTKLIDPVKELFDSVYKDLFKKSKERSGKSLFLTTGNTTLMKKAAKLAFGVTISTLKRVTIVD